jgi:hypothetical protein
MSYEHTAKAGDKLKLTSNIKDEIGATYDLTGADVGVVVKDANTDTTVDSATATVSNESTGAVTYQIIAPTETGLYFVEWTVKDGTDTFTYPRFGYEELYVDKKLGDPPLNTLSSYNDGQYNDSTYGYI